MPTYLDQDLPWSFLARQVQSQQSIPLISNRVTNRYLFPDREIVRDWADQILYPFADSGNLALVAEYQTVMTSEGQAKADYLDFLKKSLLAQAKAGSAAGNLSYLSTLEEELNDLTVTDLARDLGFCNFDEPADNPFRLLAELSLPIYLTTSFHSLLEQALVSRGRQPTSAVYCWSSRLETTIPPQHFVSPDIKPTVEAPLVYHLYGSEELPYSMALNEDDFFEFIGQISYDLGRRDEDKHTGLPEQVSNRLARSSSSILLLGYNLYDWDFRIAFRTAIQRLTQRKRELSLLVQFEPGFADNTAEGSALRVQAYLEKYAELNNFHFYPAHVRGFLAKLVEVLK